MHKICSILAIQVKKTTYRSAILVVGKPRAMLVIKFPKITVPLSSCPRFIVLHILFILLHFAWPADPASVLVAVAVFGKAQRELSFDLLVAGDTVADDIMALTCSIEVGSSTRLKVWAISNAGYISAFLC